MAPSLPALLGVPAWVLIVAALGGVGLFLLWSSSASADSGHWPSWVTGSGLGVLGVAAWLAGRPAGWAWGLSITGPSRSLLHAVFSGSVEPLGWGTAMLVGIPVGTWVSARLKGPVRWRVPSPSDLSRRFLGGVLMGVGGTMAAGCNMGNALTGLSVLAVNSVIATVAMVLGGALAARIVDGFQLGHGSVG